MKILISHPTKYQEQTPLRFKSSSKQIQRNAVQIALKEKNNFVKTGIAFPAILGLALPNINDSKEKQAFKNDLDNCIETKSEYNLKEFKDYLLKFLRKNKYSEETIELIRTSNSLEKIEKFLKTDISILFIRGENLTNRNNTILEEYCKKRPNFELVDKIIPTIMKDSIGRTLPLAKILSTPDRDDEVLKIKEEIIKEFNVNEIFFNNNLEVAKAYKKALEILRNNNIEYNGNIITCSQYPVCGLSYDYEELPTIIINPKSNSYKLYKIDLCNVILHEILHTTQPNTTRFHFQEIPVKYNKIVNGISEYAKDNDTPNEIHCELLLKKLTKGLDKKEEELLDFLNDYNK